MNLDICLKAIEKAQGLGADYADIRVGEVETKTITVRDGNVSTAQNILTGGFGIRTLVNGAWGFSGSIDLDSIDESVEKAVKIAHATALVRRSKVELAEVNPVVDSYRTPLQRDPFKVDDGEIIDTLIQAEATAHGYSEYIRTATATYRAYRDKKLLVTSMGAQIDQEMKWCGGILECTAVRSGESQPRRYPDRRGRYCTTGYEHFEELDLPGHAEKVGREAVALLDAERLPETKSNAVIRHDQMVIQIHESVGHPTELDRALGTEADFAGTSFLTTDMLGTGYRFGSDIVNLVADPTEPKGLGTFAYDDDGVKAHKSYLVKNGKFVNYLSSRETAAELGLQSTGCARSMYPYDFPIVRMTNVNLEPGDWKWEEIVEDTSEGVLLQYNKSHSIDDRRLNFQFGVETAYQIKNGSIEGLYKNVVYTGLTPEFWGSCDAISKDDWRMDGTIACGKAVPGQGIYVGHGVGSARFKNVRMWSA